MLEESGAIQGRKAAEAFVSSSGVAGGAEALCASWGVASDWVEPQVNWRRGFSEAFAAKVVEARAQERFSMANSELTGRKGYAFIQATNGFFNPSRQFSEDWPALSGEPSKGSVGQSNFLSREAEGNNAVGSLVAMLGGESADAQEASPFLCCHLYAVDHPGILGEFPSGFRSGNVFFIPKGCFYRQGSLEGQRRAAASIVSRLLSEPEIKPDMARALAKRHGIVSLENKGILDDMELWSKDLSIPKTELESAWSEMVKRNLESLRPNGTEPGQISKSLGLIEAASNAWEVFDAVKEGLRERRKMWDEPIWRMACHLWRSLAITVACDSKGYLADAIALDANLAINGHLEGAKIIAKALVGFEGSGPSSLPLVKMVFRRACKKASKRAREIVGESDDGLSADGASFVFDSDFHYKQGQLTWGDLKAADGRDLDAWLCDEGSRGIAQSRGGLAKRVEFVASRARWREASKSERLAAVEKAWRECGANRLDCSPCSLGLAAFGSENLAREAAAATAFMGMASSKAGAGLWRVRLGATMAEGCEAYMRQAVGKLADNEIVFQATPSAYLHEWTHHFECASRRRLGADSEMAKRLDAFAHDVASDSSDPIMARDNMLAALKWAPLVKNDAIQGASALGAAIESLEGNGKSLAEAASFLLGYPHDHGSWTGRQKMSAILLGEIIGSREERSGLWALWCGRQLGKWGKANKAGALPHFGLFAEDKGFEADLKLMELDGERGLKILAGPLTGPSPVGVERWMNANCGYWIKKTEVIARGMERAFEASYRAQHGDWAARAMEMASEDSPSRSNPEINSSAAWTDRLLASQRKIGQCANAAEMPWENVAERELALRKEAIDKVRRDKGVRWVVSQG